MYIFNIYKNSDQLKTNIDNIEEKDFDKALFALEKIIFSYTKKWHKYCNQEIVTFRIEVIDQENNDIRNLIWESKEGFLEACSIEKYVRHLINKETYQIWVKDYIENGSICKFAE